MRLFIWVSLVPLLLVVGCTSQQNEQQAPKQVTKIDTTTVISEGKMITQAAFKTLSSNLKQALAEDGVPYALQFCQVEAMPLTDSLSTNYGVKLQRASHRPRNPANRADSLELATIQQYLQQIEAGNDPKPTVYSTPEHVTYHAPIRVTGKLCLNCHGEPGSDITKENLQTIQELYPNDEATGFSMGDLRGIWSVEFPAAYFDTLAAGSSGP